VHRCRTGSNGRDGLGIQWEDRGGEVGLAAEPTNSESFEEIAEWAHSTLPQEIRKQLRIFPAFKWLTSHPMNRELSAGVLEFLYAYVRMKMVEIQRTSY
jgi:hypothetical protein